MLGTETVKFSTRETPSCPREPCTLGPLPDGKILLQVAKFLKKILLLPLELGPRTRFPSKLLTKL
jgi:hypothetical protein